MGYHVAFFCCQQCSGLGHGLLYSSRSWFVCFCLVLLLVVCFCRLFGRFVCFSSPVFASVLLFSELFLNVKTDQSSLGVSTRMSRAVCLKGIRPNLELQVFPKQHEKSLFDRVFCTLGVGV